MSQRPPAQPLIVVPRPNPHLGKGRVINKPNLIKPTEHLLSNVGLDSLTPQGLRKLNPSPRPNGKQPKTDVLGLLNRIHNRLRRLPPRPQLIRGRFGQSLRQRSPSRRRLAPRRLPPLRRLPARTLAPRRLRLRRLAPRRLPRRRLPAQRLPLRRLPLRRLPPGPLRTRRTARLSRKLIGRKPPIIPISSHGRTSSPRRGLQLIRPEPTITRSRRVQDQGLTRRRDNEEEKTHRRRAGSDEREAGSDEDLKGRRPNHETDAPPKKRQAPGPEVPAP